MVFTSLDPNCVKDFSMEQWGEQWGHPTKYRLQNYIPEYIIDDRNRALRRIPQQEIALPGRQCPESDNETTPVDFIQPNNGGWKAIGGGLTSRW